MLRNIKKLRLYYIYLIRYSIVSVNIYTVLCINTFGPCLKSEIGHLYKENKILIEKKKTLLKCLSKVKTKCFSSV